MKNQDSNRKYIMYVDGIAVGKYRILKNGSFFRHRNWRSFESCTKLARSFVADSREVLIMELNKAGGIVSSWEYDKKGNYVFDCNEKLI
jgi:hypothetical protein